MNKAYTIHIHHDDYPEPPRDGFDEGVLSRYIGYHRDHQIGGEIDERLSYDWSEYYYDDPWTEFEKEFRRDHKSLVYCQPLGLVDHGSNGHELRITDRWQCGLVYVTREQMKEVRGWQRLNKTRQVELERDIKAELKYYNDWVNGNCYYAEFRNEAGEGLDESISWIGDLDDFIKDLETEYGPLLELGGEVWNTDGKIYLVGKTLDRVTLPILQLVNACEESQEAFIDKFGEDGNPTPQEVFQALAEGERSEWFFWLCKHLPGYQEAIGNAQAGTLRLIASGEHTVKDGFAFILGNEPVTVRIVGAALVTIQRHHTATVILEPGSEGATLRMPKFHHHHIIVDNRLKETAQ